MIFFFRDSVLFYKATLEICATRYRRAVALVTQSFFMFELWVYMKRLLLLFSFFFFVSQWGPIVRSARYIYVYARRSYNCSILLTREHIASSSPLWSFSQRRKSSNELDVVSLWIQRSLPQCHFSRGKRTRSFSRMPNEFSPSFEFIQLSLYLLFHLERKGILLTAAQRRNEESFRRRGFDNYEDYFPRGFACAPCRQTAKRNF